MIPGWHRDQYAMFAENLEKDMAGGCQVPGCTHQNHATNPMFLTGRCHLNQGQTLREDRDPNGRRILVVSCRVCGRFCAAVYIESYEGLMDTPHLHYPNWRVDIGYDITDGYLTILCASPDCREKIGSARVMRDPTPDAPVIPKPLQPMRPPVTGKRRRIPR